MKLASTLVLAAFFCVLSTNPSRANLLARWAFDDGQGATASDEVSGFDGVLEGDSVMLPGGGVSGGNIDIGDTGFVNVGDHLQFTGTESFSIQMWIRTTQVAHATLQSRHLVGVVAGYGLGLGNPNNGNPVEPEGSFYLYQSDNPQLNSGPPGLNDGEWHQVVSVRDSYRNQLRLYVDGERAPLPTSTSYVSHINATAAPFLIGGVTVGGTPQNTYHGFIDEVRVWDDALGDAEVAFLHEFPGSLNTVLCGDHNRDATVSASDALATLRVSVGTLEGLDCIVNANGVGAITSSDALLILRDSVGQNVEFGCPLCVASDLVSLRVESPCTNGNLPVCSSSNAFSESVTMGGESGAIYDVTLSFRGVVEQKTYTGGVQRGFFYVGGAPAADGYNVTKIDVSDPVATYYLNAGTSGIQRVWELDVIETIPVRAGATVTLSVLPLDGLQIANTDGTGQPIIPDGIAPAPEAFPGQFVHVDVVATAKQE